MKNEKKAREAAMVDMNEFLIQYGNQKLPGEKHLVKTIYNAASKGLNNLDILFKDNGFARTENYLDIAKGFLVDFYKMDPKDTQPEAEKLAQEAIDYLGKHIDYFNRWEK